MRCNGEIQKVPGFENYHQCNQNVPLFRRGSLPPEELMTWKSDTWIEVADGDAVMTMHGDVALAKARLRHDAFDYVAFDGELFDVERFFVFVPDKLFLVVDRLIATTDAEVTAGQIRHSTATVSVNGENAIGFSRDGRTFMSRFAQSSTMRWNISEHDNQDNDPFYFPNLVRDVRRKDSGRSRPTETTGIWGRLSSRYRRCWRRPRGSRRHPKSRVPCRTCRASSR